MAPTFEERYILKNLKSYMRQASQDQISRHYASLAKCPEFRSLFLYLADKSPAAILRLVKMVLEKFGYKLNAKKGSRTTRKRAKLPVCHERNAKRHKIVHAAEAGTGQQDAEDDDDHEVLTKKETPNPHNNIELSDSVTHVGEYQENMCVEPTNYEVESGLASRKPIIETFVRASLLALNPGLSGPNSRTHEEITNVWRIIHLLEFFTTRSELHQHLESRENTSRHLLLAPIDWDMSEPSEILDALDNVKRSTTDNKIHRAYGQAMLVGSVDAKVARGYKSTIGNYRSSHKALLEELARDKAGSLSVMEQDQMIASCFYEYSAGQKWLAVMDWFGGSGIVLVFVVAGVGSWCVEKQWTEFQRICVRHIAGLLVSIRGLVEALGPDALGRYCRNGCLGKECLDKVKLAKFTEPDTDHGEEVEEEGDDEDEGDEEDDSD